ncbi:hypothetical protein [Allostreptomyces psammosilenae]|uniref:Uncharacterized protein n=1 Tax=Allostreptomyces psammosilenae TaxID=1892865 RepID=A0A852ZUM6_9ACTN|nr:hypothetical protein [Allostreptomyces psammosilenae]NYI06086.1 hypothetical protein [Allostreptomyces psammosilenae]
MTAVASDDRHDRWYERYVFRYIVPIWALTSLSQQLTEIYGADGFKYEIETWNRPLYPGDYGVIWARVNGNDAEPFKVRR